jgi:predicted transposase/invertase (TIGR01784 family)
LNKTYINGYNTPAALLASFLIVDFDMVKQSKHYRHQFRFRSCGEDLELTDKMEINILELQKLPAEAEASDLWYWMKLIKSDNDKEALDMIADHDPSLEKAIGVLKKLSADESARMLAEDREKRRRDIVSIRRAGVAEGEAIGASRERVALARNLLKIAMPVEQIAKVTTLSVKEIERLREE